MEYGVVIPAYDAENTIAEALESVLNQSLAPAQIIVVDDGSNDRTVAVASAVSDQIQVVVQKNQGPGAASSHGVRIAHTPLVAMLDADDLWLPEKMALQVAVLEENPRVDLVTSKMRQFHHNRPDDGAGEVRDGPVRSNITLRREVFLSVGNIVDPPGNRGDMIDWFARFREKGHRTHALDQVLALRRIIAGSLSHGRDPAKDIGYLSVAHNALKRKRQQLAKSRNQAESHPQSNSKDE
jgi:glycosyltransferase involved in cell wall biosynthesis